MLTVVNVALALLAIASAGLAATYAQQARELNFELRKMRAQLTTLDADHEGLKGAFHKLRGYVYATEKRRRDRNSFEPPPSAAPGDAGEIDDPELAALLAHQSAPPRAPGTEH